MATKKFLSNRELAEYKNAAVRAYIASTDLESALRILPIAGENRELKLLVMSVRDLSECLQSKLKTYIETL